MRLEEYGQVCPRKRMILRRARDERYSEIAAGVGGLGLAGVFKFSGMRPEPEILNPDHTMCLLKRRLPCE